MGTDFRSVEFQKFKESLAQIWVCRFFSDLCTDCFRLVMGFWRRLLYTDSHHRKRRSEDFHFTGWIYGLFESLGEVKTFTLPDGSTVCLSPSSEIVFQKAFDDTIRQISLKGEAWFDVVHLSDKPFIVKSSNLTTRVLGTRFNVNDYPEDKQATAYLQTGIIEVSTTACPERLVLHPGEYFVYDKATHQIHVSTRKPPYLYFRNATLEEIRNSLERRFNIPIRLEGTSEERYTLEFDSTVTVREVLETLCVLDERLTWRTGHNQMITICIKH